MKKVLIVVDMQNDFVTGSLGTPEARAIVPGIAEMIGLLNNDDLLFFTRDVHNDDYLNTPEGKKIPVKHCIKGTHGHQIVQSLLGIRDFTYVSKKTFGSYDLVQRIKRQIEKIDDEDVELNLVGVCSDICVVSNALILKAHFPDITIKVYKDLCAGVTPKLHEAAFKVMNSCQIDIV